MIRNLMWTLFVSHKYKNIWIILQIKKLYQAYILKNNIPHSITMYYSFNFQNNPIKLKFKLQSYC